MKDSEEEKKIQEDTNNVDYIMKEYNLEELRCATNGKIMTIQKDSYIYFFDLETGKRLQDKLLGPEGYGGYNYFNNTFWAYVNESSDPVLTSYSINGFQMDNSNDSQNTKEFFDFLKERTKKVVEQQATEKRINLRTPKSVIN
jgi:hypothetical protein